MLELKNVTKKFRKKIILSNINYMFAEGVVYTIKGKNGAGKTVLLKLLCGLMSPTEGEIRYLNNEKEITDIDYGIIIENPIFWKDKTGYETLSFLASIKNKLTKDDVINALKRVDLQEVANTRVKKYSLGMRQRLAIAQAIMENPKILLFDEPTNSLDDDGVEMFKKIILEEKEKGKIIIIVTHNIEDVSDCTDEILYLKNGKLEEEAVLK